MIYHYDWHWRFDVSPEALWPYVSNTNHFNRDAGVPHVEQLGVGSNNRQRLRLRRLGTVIEYEEEPFQWVRPHHFSVVRHFERGPLTEMRVQVDLAQVDGGTEVRYQVWATARNALGRLAIPFQIGWLSRRRFHEVFRGYAGQAATQREPALALTSLETHLRAEGDLADGAESRLDNIRQRLAREHDAKLVEQLIELVRRGDELALARIRPYVLADAWAAPRRTLVELALSATRAGLVDLQWDLMCPMCRGAKDSSASLGELPNTVHCDACNIDFEANFEQAVELSFRPAASIRPIEVYPFCVGGPQVTPHIVVQQLLSPGESRVVEPALPRGRYRLRGSNAPGFQLIDVASGDNQATLTIRDEAFGTQIPTLAEHARLELVNQSTTEQLVVIERTDWSDQALTAAEVTALQHFRDLFSAEALRPGESISVGSVTVLFTDLRESTRLYREIGDATAFGRVLDHFDVLRAALKPEEGALIKTIGDAVMAVFRRPAGAIRAILRAQELLASGPEGVQPPFLKAGAHFGPCIGVTLNDRLDYFGSTVNIAARLGGLSKGGEIVVSDAVRYDPEVIAMIDSGVVRADRFEAHLKGFEDTPFALWRITAVNARFRQC